MTKRVKRPVQFCDSALTREIRAIKRLDKLATMRGNQMRAALVEIGKRLTRVEPKIGYGNWIPWLRENFEWSDDTAQN